MKIIRQLSFISILLFLFLTFLSLLHFITRIDLILGGEIKLSDRLIAWGLIIFTFPIRNIVNLFSEHKDSWLQNGWSYFVLIASSFIWSLFIMLIKSTLCQIINNKYNKSSSNMYLSFKVKRK